MRLPDPQLLFPSGDRGAIIRFWAGYWLVFLLLLPWMLARQLWVTAGDLLAAVWTAGRRWRLLDGDIEIGFVGCAELLVTSGMFGERFTWIRHRDVVIDPGPANTRREILAALDGGGVEAVAVTHFHEEHIGNAAVVSSRFGVPVMASVRTLAEISRPAAIPDGRRLLMGQPESAEGVRGVALRELIATSRARLLVVAAEGHCEGHVAFYEPQRGILFAGDAFLHEIYTAPNRDSDAASWIATLERFAALRVATLVGSHSSIRSRDPAVPRIPGVSIRADPDRLIAEKLAFLRWARAVVVEGERRGLPYSVIEACLFPWHRPWSWRTWFHDEGFRLLTCGEFSRTHFVRSLSAHPERVPARFPAFARLGGRLAVLGPELLRVHVLAARPLPVLVIAASIGLSAAALLGAASLAGVEMRAGAAALADAGPGLVRGHPGWLAALMGIWTWWWAVVGGGVTRLMGLAVIGAPDPGFAAALRQCLSPAIYLPSAMASLCLLAIACAESWPWLLLAVPPVWLVAGMLYGATCVDRLPLRRACANLLARGSAPGRLLARQMAFLVGFVASTAVVYAIAAAWWACAALIGGGWTTPLALLIASPAMVYALGYTTANLKSLQLWLYARP